MGERCFFSKDNSSPSTLILLMKDHLYFLCCKLDRILELPLTKLPSRPLWTWHSLYCIYLFGYLSLSLKIMTSWQRIIACRHITSGKRMSNFFPERLWNLAWNTYEGAMFMVYSCSIIGRAWERCAAITQ